MRAGEFDRVITLQRLSATGRDAFNAPASAWLPFAVDLPAAKKDVSDGERQRMAELGATIDTRFRIRWDPALETLNPRDQLVFEGRTFDIAGVKEIGRHEGWEISARARAE